MQPAAPVPRTSPPSRPSAPSVDSSRRLQLLVALLSVIAGSADVISFLGLGRPVRRPRHRQPGHLAAHLATGNQIGVGLLLSVPPLSWCWR